MLLRRSHWRGNRRSSTAAPRCSSTRQVPGRAGEGKKNLLLFVPSHFTDCLSTFEPGSTLDTETYFMEWLTLVWLGGRPPLLSYRRKCVCVFFFSYCVCLPDLDELPRQDDTLTVTFRYWSMRATCVRTPWPSINFTLLVRGRLLHIYLSREKVSYSVHEVVRKDKYTKEDVTTPMEPVLTSRCARRT